MLIYARVSGSPTDLEDLSDPQPPPRATCVVEELNTNHEKACEEYSARFVLPVSLKITELNASVGRQRPRNTSIRQEAWSWTYTERGVCPTKTKML